MPSIQDVLDVIDQNAPAWATETTLSSLLLNKHKDAALVNVYLKSKGAITDDEFDDIVADLAATARRKQRSDGAMGALLTEYTSNVNSMSTSLGRDMSVANATEMLSEMSSGLNATFITMSSWSAAQTGFWKNLSGPLKVLGYVSAIIGTVINFFGGAAFERAKESEKLLDLGTTINTSLADYDNLREAYARSGLKFDEFAKVIQNHKGTFANITGDLTEASTILARMPLDKVMGEMGSMGFDNAQIAEALALETEHMYLHNEVDNLKEITREKIAKRFQSTTLFATFLSDGLGLQRSELLANRAAQKKDVEYIAAISKSKDFIIEQFGEEKFNTIQLFTEQLLPALSAFMPGMENMTDEALKRYLYNIQTTDNPFMAFGEEMMTNLAMLGEGVPDMFANIYKRIATDKTYGTSDAISDFSDMISHIATLPVELTGGVANLEFRNTIIATAQAMGFELEDLKEKIKPEMTREEMAKALKESVSLVDHSNKIGQVARTFHELLTLGFENSSVALKGMSSAFDITMRVLSVLPGFEYESAIPKAKPVSNTSKEMTKKGFNTGGSTTSSFAQLDAEKQARERLESPLYGVDFGLQTALVEQKIEVKAKQHVDNAKKMLETQFAPAKTAIKNSTLPKAQQDIQIALLNESIIAATAGAQKIADEYKDKMKKIRNIDQAMAVLTESVNDVLYSDIVAEYANGR